MIPQILFPGGVSDHVRESAIEDVIKTVEFYIERFGLIVPGLTIYFPVDCDAFKAEALPQHADDIRATCGSVSHFAAAGWAGADYIVVFRFEHIDWYDLSKKPIESNLELFTHEYAHSLQFHLARDDLLRAPRWIVEGMAEWLGDWSRIDAVRTGAHDWGKHGSVGKQPKWNAERGLFGEPTWDAERTRWRKALFDSRTPTLRSTEEGGLGGPQYDMGLEAVELLVQGAGVKSLFDFWRALAPKMVAPDLNWRSQLDWPSAFQLAFGLSVERFYEHFDTWMDAQTEGREFSRVGYQVLQGRLVDANSDPLLNAKVQLIPERGWGSSGRYSYTTADGRFTTLASHHNWDYKIQVTLENGCRAFYGGNGWAKTYAEATPFAVDYIPIDLELVWGALPGEEYGMLGIDGQRETNLRLPRDLCNMIIRRVRGVTRLSETEPLSGMTIRWQTSERHGTVSTDADGAFELLGKDGDRFRIFLVLTDECVLTYESGGFANVPYISHATNVRVDGGDVELTASSIPVDACR